MATAGLWDILGERVRTSHHKDMATWRTINKNNGLWTTALRRELCTTPPLTLAPQEKKKQPKKKNANMFRSLHPASVHT